MKIKFISAGAGSGKTYRLTNLMSEKLVQKKVRPEAVMAMTFTTKAADELVERVRQQLIEDNQFAHANSMGQAEIGTVNSVCGRILKRYSFEAGLSPDLEVLTQDESPAIFAQAIDQVITKEDIKLLNSLGHRLGLYEWKEEIKNIIDLVRSNDMSLEDLSVFAQASNEDLLQNFTAPTKSDLSGQLKKAVDAAIIGINENEDETVGTKKYLSFLYDVKHHLNRNSLTWSNWVKLSKEKPTAQSKAFAEAIHDIALRYDSHPDLQNDIKTWTNKLFSLAESCLERYQSLKAERGLMDFVDQEHQVLKLLELPAVADAITQELDLLLIDEFQDTSPIQLALFLKLADCAKECVWVGDIKQAIYGFRGSDPELMKAVIRKLGDSEKSEVEYLKSSWRSRPALVELINEIFPPAFSGYLTVDQVKLDPQLKEQLNDNAALQFWNLSGGNIQKIASAQAAGIIDLLGSGTKVIDKETKVPRDMTFGDVALLTRSNDNAYAYAAALSSCGLPVALSQAGLLNAPEIHLIIAGLRRLVDSGDTLASAEIISLKSTGEPENWLESRLEYIEKEDNHKKWGIEGDFAEPALVRLEAIREHLKYLSPTEVVDEVLRAIDVRRDAIAWGPTKVRSKQRLENIETLRGYSTKYENHCHSQRISATVGGFLLWLYALADAEQDMKGGDSQTNAIKVMTYHKAKGLEWPVVIAADLEASIRSDAWGLSILTGGQGFDMDAPLANRQIRYWPWPFAKQKKGIAVADRIEDGDAGKQAERKAIDEAVRLLYVGLTRARDILILPYKQKYKTRPWLEAAGGSWLVPENNTIMLPSNKAFPCIVETYEEIEPNDDIPDGQDQKWFAPSCLPTEKLPANISPSSQALVERATIGKTIEIGSRLILNGSPDIEVLGNALHNIIASDLISQGFEEKDKVTADILKRYSLETFVDEKQIVEYTPQLLSCIQDAFKPVKILPEWPVFVQLEGGQHMRGWIDLLLETEHGYVIIDHKSYPGKRSDWENKALSYSGQLDAYRRAVQKATNKPVLSQWINFTVGGAMTEVIFSDN